MLSRVSCLAFAGLFILAAGARAQKGFDGCGTLVLGPSCVVFESDSGGYFPLETYSTFQVGAHVRVQGVLSGCPGCSGPNGCITNNTIEPCGAGSSYCMAGDWFAIYCPCQNVGGYDRGCRNSAPSNPGARLSESGSTVPDTLVLSATEMLPTALCIFLQGQTELVSTAHPFGDGYLCTGGQLLRLCVKNAVGGSASYPEPGEPSITERAAQLGAPIPPGALRFYQTYYRDPDPLFCPAAQGGGTFNITGGVGVTWS